MTSISPATAWLITWLIASALLMYFGWQAIPDYLTKLALSIGVSMNVAALIFGAMWAMVAVAPFLILMREAMK